MFILPDEIGQTFIRRTPVTTRESTCRRYSRCL